MKKKIRNLYRFLLLFGCLSLGSKTLSSQNMFDDLFKGFDFDAFLKDMEKAYDDDAEHKTFGGAAKMPQASTPAGISEKTVITKAPIKKPQSKEELFLSPVTQTIQEKGRTSITKLTPESLNAFKEIMHEFIVLLDAVVTKIEGSRIFSLPFKEQFIRYRDAVDKIAISYGIMISKKMYATIMPYQATPNPKTGKPAMPAQKVPQPAQAMNLRKNIVDAIAELRAIDKDLSSLLEDEEKETDEPILKELSKKKRKHVTFEQAPLSKSSRRKASRSEQTEKKQPQKHTKTVTAPESKKANTATTPQPILDKKHTEQPVKSKSRSTQRKPASKKVSKAPIKEVL